MVYSNQELVDLGARFSTQRMLEQLPVSVTVARRYTLDLSPMFPAARVDELDALRIRIAGLFETQSEKKFEANTGNVPVQDKMRTLKEHLRDIIAAADNGFEEEPAMRAQFHKGPLGRSVPSLVRRGAEIVALAEENADVLGSWGLSPEKIADTKTALSDLVAANTNQESALVNLPSSTQDLYLEKGRAYLLLKKLVRAGRRCLANRSAAAAEFNLDILNRKGTRRPGEKGASEESTVL